MKKLQPKKNHWIFWRNRGQKHISKSYVQEITPTIFGKLMDLSDTDIYTKYPNRLLLKEIVIIKVFKV